VLGKAAAASQIEPFEDVEDRRRKGKSGSIIVMSQ